MKLKVTVNGIPYDIEVEVEEEEKVAPTIVIGGAGGMQTPVAATASVRATSANAVVAPLSGSVSKILVEEGQEIKEGAVLVVLEAMKMETEITAPHDGTVARILVSKGESVAGGEALIEFDKS
ncbi:biotin/lipoyl-containing protein [Propioniciclava tarda]|uniref:Biotin/lipoyl-binding protein n=1 Tax=Propioniciclava tarda TaxID=433330 RepID=A0A4V2JT31_PROTD|nr:biotin/lipoyl-containing protein [Propioniciclava tarda]TBT94651.1 biotin/lipoyl-binding protein [Propioniciclava tarda]SMO67136.1 methylmalonyl-CoA carboxyltransferase 1.3S subunit [Propioniciclava tarda]HOA90014.1 biotin/lipoyl-binding protein [Propioniciclava tarda]HQA30286.1 biotin/lipoyl-binding protein [Propioniciclava tarda]HQD61829.1 biotin/lipoyl-binding protein [Propioniciclava tarda]